jgi:hypothetical protein
VERFDRVIVDRKQVDDDRIDDLEITAHGLIVRRQFKSSENPNRVIATADFTGADSTVRIDRLVLTYVRAGQSPAHEYRLCATWQPPTDSLADLLEPIEAVPTFERWPSRHFRVRGERLWPADAPPLWQPLVPYTQAGAEFSRDQLLAFCQRFIIELALPIASTDLRQPGPLEQAVIDDLSDRVGIGRYPNQGRQPSDVAALCVSLANLARTQEATLVPSEIEWALDIRTDFGRVAQAFPLDEAVFFDRPTFRQGLRQASLAGRHHLVVGPPGAGKSWELTRLATELRDAGAIVARHYCYLEPGDALVERRVTTDVFFGNVLAELTEAAPELIGAATARYAAGLTELEETLRRAVGLGRPVVLIIDGLDHIARVRDGSDFLSAEDTDIVERLSLLDIPEGVALIVGSQPGGHLDVLRSRWGAAMTEEPVRQWPANDIEALATRYGVLDAIRAAGIADDDQSARILSRLSERADGNPLFARYLSRALVQGLRDGAIPNPLDWLADVPAINGDIAIYYEYLYRAASREAQAIADVLGVIDFSITESALREILPAFVGDWVPQALRVLRPMLEVAAAQGGMRIFHESFRRFMTAELSRQGRSVASALEPVIAWLERRDFYRDARSYRFLLPALRRAGRNADVLARVGVTFVSDSVAHAHSQEAIERNVALAADVAASERNWVALVRCAELQRATYTCFFDFHDPESHYWPTYLELFGAEALADRLLFDGRPTRSREEGLLACSLVDDAGGTAPWREYLDLDLPRDSEHAAPDHDGLSRDDHIQLAAIHGQLRTGEQQRILRRLYAYLRESGDNFDRAFIRAVAVRIARVSNPAVVTQLANRADPTTRRGARISSAAAAVLRVGVADEFYRRGDRRAGAEWATLAVQTADTPELALDCMLRGAPPDVARRAAVDPSTLPIAVGPDRFFENSSSVRQWIASVRLLATDAVAWPAIAARERERLAGEGWYRCWLRFVLALADADAARRYGRPGTLDEALTELTRDTRRFVGEPRACDLYRIWTVIADSLAWALSLAGSAEEWTVALDAITKASHETGTRLDREDGGPISTGALLDVLARYVADPVGGRSVGRVFEQEVELGNRGGTYYGTHAEFEMRLARIRHRAGDVPRADEAWRRSAVFLAAYGFHKDITIFDPIESAPALAAASTRTALSALANLQSLTMAAVAHTDGRETKNAPNVWFRSLVEVDAATAISLLAQTAVAEDHTGGWPTAEAIHNIAKSVGDSAEPFLIDAVLRTVPVDTGSEHDASKDAGARLAPIPRLAASDRPFAQDVFRRVLAEVRDDARRHKDAAMEEAQRVATQVGIALPEALRDINGQRADTNRTAAPAQPKAHTLGSTVVFSANPRFVDLLKGLRIAGERRGWENPEEWDAVVTSLAYRLGEFIDAGKADDAERVLRFFARDVRVSLTSAGKLHPLASLAEALEAAGYRRAAAIGYTLAYTVARGGWGWLHLGDKSHGYLVARAIALDGEVARRVLSQEVGYALRSSGYAAGTSRHLIERFAEWGDAATAVLAWRESFAVIAHRLPLVPGGGWFERLDLDAIPDWSVDEALVALLLGQLSEARLRQKLGALDGVVRAIQRRPELVLHPIRWWVTHPRSQATSILAVLHALLHAETAPWPITVGVSDALADVIARPSWGARRLALQLLRRAALPEPAVPRDCAAAIAADASFAEDRRARLRFADVGDTLDELEPIWPELPDLVLRRLHRLLEDDPDSDDRVTERYRLMWGRTRRSTPATPVLLWQTEMLVQALHTELTGLPAHLWESGQWNPEIEDSILATLTPDTRVHLGLAASRTTRPPWPFPEAVRGGVGALETVTPDDEAAYHGWSRLAIVERQYIADPNRPYEPPNELVRLFGGVVALPLGDRIPDGAFPFADGDPQHWWLEPLPARFPAGLPLGPLVRLHRRTDWLGDAFVLIPPPLLRSYITLDAPAYGAPFVWRDTNGTPAIVLRTWRVRNVEAVDAEPVTCEGTDLIARPDITDRLRALLGVDLQELTVVNRADLRDMDE